MPFDIAEFQIPAEAKEADPFDYRTFTPGLEGLRKLAWVLRHPEVWPKGQSWNFMFVEYEQSCGTMGCAIGIGRNLWPELKDATTTMAFGADVAKTAQAFKIAPGDAHELFYDIRAYGQEDTGAGFARVTPADVASAIDAYLARAEALAKSEAGGTP